MCGITGAINIKDHRKIASKALNKIIYRGLDAFKTHSEKNATFSHCLHSVVGNQPQPIIKENFIFATNCEIYNWKELKTKHKLNSKNDAELLLDLLTNVKPTEKSINDILKQLDGVFAFFLHNKKHNYTIIARDLLGVKPIWFNYKKHLIFASERKAIEQFEPEELNPRKIILYKNKKLKFFNQDFFNIKKQKVNIKPLLVKAIKKRIPDKNLGLLFSAGLDSTFLAHMLTQSKTPFTAYMTVSDSKNDEIKKAKEISKKLKFKLKIVKINKELVKKELPKIINLIETADPIKVEVATTLYFALKEAQKDKIKVIFSGLGADDIFGGYSRMHQSQDITLDSLSSLRKLYEKDLYRDDVLSMYHNIELRLPYLDKQLVQACLNTNLPNKTPKELLRKIALQLKLPKELTELKRNAAQYSSGISKITTNILKESKEHYKGQYFSKILKRKNLKLASLFSSGKDSIYALHIQDRLNYQISCLITIDSQNKDSYMFHTPTINLAKTQAKSLNIPIILQKTKGKKEIELRDLELAIKKAKDKYKIQGIITGAIFSNYQRTRIEEICDNLNLKCYSPLWHMDQSTLMSNLIKNNFKFIITKIAADGFNTSWLNKTITIKELNELIKLNKQLQINIAGEGGEFETFVLDAPLFKNQLKVEKSKILGKENTATLIIEKLSSKRK